MKAKAWSWSWFLCNSKIEPEFLMKEKIISLARRSRGASHARRALSAIVSATLLAAALPSLQAQLLPVSYEYLPYALESGRHDNASAEEEAPFSALIEVTNAPILRVHFGSYNLGARSYLMLISVRDN